MRPKRTKTVGVAVKHVGHRVNDHRCTLVVAHDEVEALTGTDQQLVLMLDPVKNTVNQLFVDIRSIMKTDRFELCIDGRPLPRSKGRKKLHKVGAYGGGTLCCRSSRKQARRDARTINTITLHGEWRAAKQTGK